MSQEAVFQFLKANKSRWFCVKDITKEINEKKKVSNLNAIGKCVMILRQSSFIITKFDPVKCVTYFRYASYSKKKI